MSRYLKIVTRPLKSSIAFVLNLFGLRVSLLPGGLQVVRVRSARLAKFKGVKVYMGSGTDNRDGFLSCDIRKVGNVKIVCKAWELSNHATEVEEIFSRHMVEHLTFDEVHATLADWYHALAVGGIVEVWVPNMDFHIRQWLDADWTDEAWNDRESDMRWGAAGFYGWQRECNPRASNYTGTYWDVHKSGFTKQNATYFFQKHCFGDVDVKIVDDIHLVIRAKKLVREGERQVATSISEIRQDHRGRYEFAADQLNGAHSIMDVSCGIGYGSRMLADALPHARISGVDIDSATIEFAKKHFANPRITFINADATNFEFETKDFDAAVCFETIEHIDNPGLLLTQISRHLKPEGTLVCSTPNQDVVPFNTEKFPYHVRHFTSQELEELLEVNGFQVRFIGSQKDKTSRLIDDSLNGRYLVARAILKKSATNPEHHID